VQSSEQPDHSGKSHHWGKPSLAYMRRTDSFHNPESNRRHGSHATGHCIVGRSGISYYSLDVPISGSDELRVELGLKVRNTDRSLSTEGIVSNYVVEVLGEIQLTG
jgi:hypothetical protein